MNSQSRRSDWNPSGRLLTHVASALVLAATLIFETKASVYIGEGSSFLEFIPAIIIISYLEDRGPALAATILMVAVGLWARSTLHGQISGEDWARAILLVISGGVIAMTFHRLRQDLRELLEVAEARLAAVEATENRYRWAFERAAMGFANTNERGELLQSNRRLSEMTGYEEEELAQLRLETLVHPDDRDALAQLLAGLGNDAASFASEVRLLRKNGSAFWARLTLSSSVPDGVLSESIFVVVDDISERRAVHEALRAQKEWLDLALSAGRLATWRIDLKDGIVTGSGTFWDILGLPPAASRRLDELSAVIHPADWPKLVASRKLASVTNYDVEIRVRRPDGHIRWVALRGREEKYDDRLQRLGVAADLTERRQTTLLRAAAKKRERIMLEQRHRFSNLFPVITALVNMVDVHENNVARYKETLVDRIRALEATHLLLSRNGNASGMLHDLVVQELQPYMGTRDISVSGPSVVISGGAAESFAMIVHELATNSLKHGALGDSKGRIEVNWTFASEDAGSDIVFEWVESGRRRTSKVVRHGFGSMILGVDGAPLVGYSPKLEMSDHGLRYSLRLSRKEIGP
ncbi:MAG: PAS domain S-box protein [Mesorhizobium sp.]|nr:MULTISPECIES: PAS domain S-box protein [unclassified Mesorhizobium]RUV74037.1 PAS domain S-box protein [Mesorhizobium sp. M5C.F.Cr.IN.023.01.1.1]RWF87128.1 MAG: PAS domain S-box protein [Mesorhizobium sp.]RWF95891.1 MAG: PAS domain S-box protein [Mesorhizobium sp.]RWI40889.1 MAG: PAS domain S-box protein [Mesorhizobium sp.]RWI46758.1 MAG: PAS domain S-box protein [Mesorhizobium sp.]